MFNVDRMVKCLYVLFALVALGGITGYIWLDGGFFQALCLVPAVGGGVVLLEHGLMRFVQFRLGGALGIADDDEAQNRKTRRRAQLEAQSDTTSGPNVLLSELQIAVGSNAPTLRNSAGAVSYIRGLVSRVAQLEKLQELDRALGALREPLIRELRSHPVEGVIVPPEGDVNALLAATGLLFAALVKARDDAARESEQKQRQIEKLTHSASEAEERFKEANRKRQNANQCHAQLCAAVVEFTGFVTRRIPQDWWDRPEAVLSSVAETGTVPESTKKLNPLNGHLEALRQIAKLQGALQPLDKFIATAAKDADSAVRLIVLEERVGRYVQGIARLTDHAVAYCTIVVALARHGVINGHSHRLAKIRQLVSDEAATLKRELTSSDMPDTTFAVGVDSSVSLLFDEKTGLGHIMRLLALNESFRANELLRNRTPTPFLAHLLATAGFTDPAHSQIFTPVQVKKKP